MNAIEQARKAYAPAAQAIRTPRATEAQLLTDVTRRLNRRDSDFPTLAAAVHDNRRIWTSLAISVADAENSLPAELRAQIFYLAEFTDHHSRRFLRGEADLAPLVDVNTAVIRGLNGMELAS